MTSFTVYVPPGIVDTGVFGISQGGVERARIASP